MRISAATVCIVAATIPLAQVATFTPSTLVSHNRASLSSLSAATTENEIPDLVAAYAKKRQGLDGSDLPTPQIADTTSSAGATAASVAESSSSSSSPDISDVRVAVEKVSQEITGQKASASSTPSFDMTDTADQINDQFKGMNSFFKSAQDQLAARSAEASSSAVGSAAKSSAAVGSPSLPPGKAPTLIEYLAGGFGAGGSGASDGSSVAQAKLALMIDNTYAMFGAKPPHGSEASAIDFTGNLPEGVTPEMATGLAVASFALLAAGANANNNNASTTSSTKAAITEESEAEESITDIAKDVKAMAERIKELSAETKQLRDDLMEANARLTRKELEISQEQYKSADTSLKYSREIDRLTAALKASEKRTKLLEEELALAEGKSIKEVKESVPFFADPPMPEPVPEAAPTPTTPKAKAKKKTATKKAAPKKKAATKDDAKTKEKTVVAKKKSTIKGVTNETGEEPAKKSTIKDVTNETGEKPAKKKSTIKGVKNESSEEPKAPAVKKAKSKAKAKAKVTKVKVMAKKDGGDWSSLSDSTLTRKTVKELTSYLADKGVVTADGNGKPLKKALLVEAVRAL